MDLTYTFHHTNEKQQKAFFDFLNEWSNTKDFIEVNTSGSTGKPKNIYLKKTDLVISAKKTLAFFNLKPNDTSNLCLSIETIAGKMMIIRSIIGQLHLHIYEPNQLEHLEVCNFMALVPMQLNELVNQKLNILKQCTTILVGGAPISPSLEEYVKKNKLSVYQSFGMTETISHFAIRKITDKGSSFFQTLDKVKVSIDDQKHLIVDYPEIGIHQLKTNDLIHWISPTQFEWIGRSDFTINSGGIKIQLEEIEKEIAKYWPNIIFFTFGIPDLKLGQKLILIVEGEENDELNLTNLKNKLPRYQNPKAIYFLPKFVRTKSDKINRIKTISLLNL